MAQQDGNACVIWWLRRDLRLDDNPALLAALETGLPVIPVFVWAPEEEGQFQQGRYSRWWTKHSVMLFQQLIEQLGSRLIIRRSAETSRGLMQVVHDTGARAVFFNHLYDPISLVRDHEVKSALTQKGVECKSFNSDLLYEPWEVLDSNQEPFTCFELFWNRVLEMPNPPPFPLPAPTQLPAVDPQLFSLAISEVDWFMTPEQEASSDQLKFKWRPGVEGAVDKLESFLGTQLHTFEHDRAKVDRHSTSQLSPWIHSGTISVRYIFYRVCQRQAELRMSGQEISTSCKDFLQQLGYREYSRYLSFHFPFIHERSLLAHLRACPWRMDQQHFKAWRQGQTGYPLVDAAMRELWSTGWCHNRMRVVAASFMVKNLLLPWQWGLKHYWDAQMDADLECDALGWQYVSGGMTDAHPFNYIIDLDKEAAKFDPDGEYVRRWLPVLSRLPTKHIHSPWDAPAQVLMAADVELGFNYPERIITVEQSKANMEKACQVLESCASHSGQNRHPFRAPTMPTKSQLGKEGGWTSQDGNGTGTGTHCDTPNGVDRAPRGSHPAARVSPEGGQLRQKAHARAYAKGMVPAVEAASVHLKGSSPHRPRARIPKPPPSWDLAANEGSDENDEGGEEVHGGLQQGAGQGSPLLSMSSAYSDDDMSDGGMSEEVVSNTIGLSAPQPSGWSERAGHMMDDNEAEGEASNAAASMPAISGRPARRAYIQDYRHADSGRPNSTSPPIKRVHILDSNPQAIHEDMEHDSPACTNEPMHVNTRVDRRMKPTHLPRPPFRTSPPQQQQQSKDGLQLHISAPQGHGSSDAGTNTPMHLSLDGNTNGTNGSGMNGSDQYQVVSPARSRLQNAVLGELPVPHIPEQTMERSRQGASSSHGNLQNLDDNKDSDEHMVCTSPHAEAHKGLKRPRMDSFVEVLGH